MSILGDACGSYALPIAARGGNWSFFGCRAAPFLAGSTGSNEGPQWFSGDTHIHRKLVDGAFELIQHV